MAKTSQPPAKAKRPPLPDITWDDQILDRSGYKESDGLAVKRRSKGEQPAAKRKSIDAESLISSVLDEMPVYGFVPPLLVEKSQTLEFKSWLSDNHLDGSLPDRPMMFVNLIYQFIADTEPKSLVPLDKLEPLENLKERVRQKIEQLEASRGKGKNENEEKEILKKVRKLRKEGKKIEKRQEKLVNQVKEQNSSAKKTMDTDGSKSKSKGSKQMPIFNKLNLPKKNQTAARHRKQPKGKNYSQLLGKVQSQESKLAKLAEANPEKAEEKKSKSLWEGALAKAEGAKLKNDPVLLKKSIKKKEKRKQASAKKWEHRKEQLDERKKRKMESREQNLQSQQDKRKAKKFKKGVKRGHIIPGFRTAK